MVQPRGRVRPIGVITNRTSHRNRQSGAATASGPPGVLWAEPGSAADLLGVLADFVRREVATVVVDGGDGTVRDVLTALCAEPGGDAPDLALMPSGRTNVIARDVGGIGRGQGGIARLQQALAGDRPLGQTLRPAIAVTVGSRRLCGMLFGAGAFTYSKQLLLRRLEAGGMSQGPLVALALAAVLRHSLIGRDRRALLAGELMGLSVDGSASADGHRFLVLATAMHRLMLGLWPFDEGGEAPLHWLDVAAPPRGLLRLTAAAFAGRASRRLASCGHASGRATSLHIVLEQAFVLDGDLFSPGADGVRLDATPPFRFLTA